ncbi:MAG: CsbD family protein [Balneolia bacterium]|nr:CsbD family protein [Balneolia bacterium]
MDDLELKGNWNQIKGELKKKYGDLTDDDLTYVEGEDDAMLGRLQERLGKTKKEIASEIRKFLEE